MSILVNKHSKVIVQGFTGKEGTFQHPGQGCSCGHGRKGARVPQMDRRQKLLCAGAVCPRHT